MDLKSKSAEEILEGTFFFNQNGYKTKIKIVRIPLVNLNLSVRFIHVLEQTDIYTLQDLLNTSPDELLSIRNCGKKSIHDAQYIVKNFVLANPEIFEGNFNNPQPKSIKIPLFGLVPIDLANNLEKIKNIFLCQINLPTRIKSYITEHKELKTIGDIAKIDFEELFKKKNLGKNSIIQLRNEIKEIAYYDSRRRGLLLNDPKYILELIDDFLEKLEPKRKNIFILRWGGEEKLSYKEIGNTFSLTRERIRQIISSILKSLKTKILPNKEIYYKYFLEKLLVNLKPISFDLLNSFPLITRKYSHSLYLGILSEIFDEVPFEGYLIKNFEQYISRYSPSKDIFAFHFEKLSKINIPFKQITPEKLFELMNVNTSKDKIALFSTIFNSKDFWFEFDSDDGKYYLFNKGNLYKVTKNILEQSPTVLTVEQILKIIKEIYANKSKYDSIPAVVGNLKQHKDIYQLDRYSFGLEKHFSYSQNEWGRICIVAKNRIKQLNRQANVSELFDYVKIKFPKLISKYELVYILRSDKEIIDLGWFNYSLEGLGVEERIKVTDVILTIFTQNPQPKHFSEIQKEILEKRFIRIEAINSILKSIDYLEYYLGGFHGLKKFHSKNLLHLANNAYYLRKMISNDIFPDTSLNKIFRVFQNEKLEESIKRTIEYDDKLFLHEDVETEPFVVSKEWSKIKIVRCILFNIGRTVYIDELKWILSDMGISLDDGNQYKLKNDKHINFDNNKLSYVEFRLTKDDADEIIEISFDILKDSTSQESIEEFCDYLNKEYVEITIDELIYLLESDERFIIIDRQMIMVK